MVGSDHAMPELVAKRAQASPQETLGGCLLDELDKQILAPLGAQTDISQKRLMPPEQLKGRRPTTLIADVETETAHLQQKLSQLNEHLARRRESARKSPGPPAADGRRQSLLDKSPYLQKQQLMPLSRHAKLNEYIR